MTTVSIVWARTRGPTQRCTTPTKEDDMGKIVSNLFISLEGVVGSP
jgi:hypothetical protein